VGGGELGRKDGNKGKLLSHAKKGEKGAPGPVSFRFELKAGMGLIHD